MSAIIVFHGGTQVIDEPVCKFGRQNLDFGAGFYVTDLREQAVSWANNMAKSRKESPILNSYRMDRDAILNNYKCKVFTAYDKEWLEFIVANRQGLNEARKYDYVEGGVANDNVIDTVEDYEKGIITSEQALGQLRYKKVNHQICILNQEVIDKYLSFIDSIML